MKRSPLYELGVLIRVDGVRNKQGDGDILGLTCE
jgi:hypothetical protein